MKAMVMTAFGTPQVFKARELPRPEPRANQVRVLQELRTYLNRDRARTRAFQVSDLGLVAK